LAFDLALPAAVFAIETSWYALVALLLSAQAPRTAYLRSKFWIDRLAGAVMAGLGLKLLLSARDL
jgi:threonine/homoserine/homoserine lactone efflux protein